MVLHDLYRFGRSLTLLGSTPTSPADGVLGLVGYSKSPAPPRCVSIIAREMLAYKFCGRMKLLAAKICDANKDGSRASCSGFVQTDTTGILTKGESRGTVEFKAH